MLLLLFVFFLSCQNSDKQGNGSFIKTDGTTFRDAAGRQIILHGINVVNKNPKVNYLGSETEETFAQFKRWGFNCVRLGIIWDGVEPRPGKIDENYLKGIDQRIQWAKKYGISIILDMHQDLYSVKYADGAPEWATLNAGKEHRKGFVWSDSYLISPAVQTAFDNFWKNTPAEDGKGLQDHYAFIWQESAKRYADEPAVVGYDLMNEPFPGSAAKAFMPAMIAAFTEIIAQKTGKVPQPEKLAAQWATEDGRLKIIESVNNPDVYKKIVYSGREINRRFETETLQPFYNKLASAIRKVDNNHILFLEHSYFSNPGIPSAIEIPTLASGQKDKNTAYAAHGYDLVTDTKGIENANNNRVDVIFDNIATTSKRVNFPVCVDEWGALHKHGEATTKVGWYLVKKLEEHHFSDTFWAYFSDIADYDFFKIIHRSLPLTIAGELNQYSYNPETLVFTCSWTENENIGEPSAVYVSLRDSKQNPEIKLLPQGSSYDIQVNEDKSGAIITIPTLNKSIKRNITVKLN